jgi:hypothetical protein
MKRLLFAAVLLLVVLLPGTATASARESGATSDFKARLTGAQEVPPVASPGTGRATFRLSEDGSKLRFRLTAQGLNNRITQAHIHLAPRGVNGGIVAFLFPLTDKGVNREGFEVAGTLTKDDLIGGLKDKPLSSLLEAMRSGGAYVNIHTVVHPGGEIRGQIQPRDDSENND